MGCKGRSLTLQEWQCLPKRWQEFRIRHPEYQAFLDGCFQKRRAAEAQLGWVSNPENGTDVGFKMWSSPVGVKTSFSR